MWIDPVRLIAPVTGLLGPEKSPVKLARQANVPGVVPHVTCLLPWPLPCRVPLMVNPFAPPDACPEFGVNVIVIDPWVSGIAEKLQPMSCSEIVIGPLRVNGLC